MELTADVVDAANERYPDVQALSAVEEEHLDILPGMFAADDFGWRDAEWVVQWYYRRYLGAYPDRDRRVAEGDYGSNTFEEVREAIAAAARADGAAEKLSHLTALDGVEVPVGTAFLQFLDPERYLVVDERTWSVLQAAGELGAEYPDPPAVEDYERYLAAGRRVAEQCDHDLTELYRALWVLGSERPAE